MINRFTPEEYKQKIIYIVDNFEVKTQDQVCEEVGVSRSVFYSWLGRMRKLGIPIPKRSNYSLSEAIGIAKNEPKVIAKIEKWTQEAREKVSKQFN